MRRSVVGLSLALLMGLTSATAVAAPSLIPPLPPLLGPRTPPPSPPASTPPPPAPATAAPEDRWALIIGVTDYAGKVKSTVGGANDARLVRDVLLRNGWRDDRIRMLIDAQATGQAVTEGMNWLQANSSPTTFSLFQYSGHVKQRDGREFLWPYDSAFLADIDVARVLSGMRGTAWSNFSGCEAAGFDEGLASPRHRVTASSQVYEKSYEDPRTGYSVWTGMLFDEGFRQQRGDADRDGVTHLDEAFDYAAPRAQTYTSDQQPFGPQTPYRAGGSGPLRLDSPRI